MPEVKDVFILLEASLEPVPLELRKHPLIAADARKRGKKPEDIILDDSKHHKAMKGLEFREKRGRPDIVHQCLLLLLDSPLKTFEIYVHTVKDLIIRIDRDTRLPRNYNRFIGLMEDLFRKKKIEANGKILLEIFDGDLKDLLKGREVILMSEKGREFERDALKKAVAICIGAFAHGDFFESTLKKLENYKEFSLGKKSYTSLYVTSRVLCEYERVRASENR
uniref:Ribosomal RNA small subunit methyltransferase Nep1 n=1 Tax=Archaeoglobus fulgidus TaxID=2234 RepID=A0A7J2TIQ9_ARCFL